MWSVIRETFASWSDHDAARIGAALAYYSLLSMAPLVTFAIAFAAVIFGDASGQEHLIQQVRNIVGAEGARVIQSLVQQAQNLPHQAAASAIGIITLLFGASGVFSELRSALNTIWDVPARKENEVVAFIRQKVFAMGIVLAVGFLLVVSLVVSTALAAFGKYFTDALPLSPWVLELFNVLISLVGLSLVFALIFRYVADTRLPWRDVWIGSVVTAVMFTIGKLLIGLYLGRTAVGSLYGASGSLVVMLVWVYYSALIFLLGAEFAHVYALHDSRAGTLAHGRT